MSFQMPRATTTPRHCQAMTLGVLCAAKKTKPSLSGSESEGSEEEKAQASDAGDAAEPKSSSEQDSETEGNAKQLSGKLGSLPFHSKAVSPTQS